MNSNETQRKLRLSIKANLLTLALEELKETYSLDEKASDVLSRVQNAASQEELAWFQEALLSALQKLEPESFFTKRLPVHPRA